jgi:integral membrane protein
MIKYLKSIAIAEGISFIAFAFTMPLKYGYDILLPNKIVGWLHGLLFIVYIASMIWGARKYNWPLKNIFIALAASLIPFAPFYVERKIITETVVKEG